MCGPAVVGFTNTLDLCACAVVGFVVVGFTGGFHFPFDFCIKFCKLQSRLVGASWVHMRL